VRTRLLKTDTGHPSTGRCQSGTRARLQWRNDLYAAPSERGPSTSRAGHRAPGEARAQYTSPNSSTGPERHAVTPTDGAYSSWSYEGARRTREATDRGGAHRGRAERRDDLGDPEGAPAPLGAAPPFPGRRSGQARTDAARPEAHRVEPGRAGRRQCECSAADARQPRRR